LFKTVKAKFSRHAKGGVRLVTTLNTIHG